MKSSSAILISIGLCLTICQSAAARDWRVVGNGGGGIVTQNGTPALYEKQKRVKWIPLDNEQFISLCSVIEVIKSLRIPPGPKHQLLQALENKTYYLIPKSEARNEDFTQAKAVYADLWDRPAEEISVFAITMVETDETLFMPEFFSLSINEQLSILLHEALWTIRPDLKYESMVFVESAFYNYLESFNHNPSPLVEQRLYAALAKHVFGNSFLVQSILIMFQKLSLSEILGTELAHCAYHSSYGCSSSDGGHTLLAKVLQENPYLRISINGFASDKTGPSMAKFYLKEIFNYQSWKATVEKPYVGIPFFHRSHTCVKLQNDPMLKTDIYLVIFDGSGEMESSPAALCGDLRH